MFRSRIVVLFCFDSSVVQLSGLMLTMVSVRMDSLSDIVPLRRCACPNGFSLPIVSLSFSADFFGVERPGMSHGLMCNIFMSPSVVFWWWCSGAGGRRGTFRGVGPL